jgi:hypothetical protein
MISAGVHDHEGGMTGAGVTRVWSQDHVHRCAGFVNEQSIGVNRA